MGKRTREISAGIFKNTCLKLIDDVWNTREEIIVTKRGKPMVRIVPIAQHIDPVGCMKGSIKILVDDIVNITSTDLGVEWEANKDE